MSKKTEGGKMLWIILLLILVLILAGIVLVGRLLWASRDAMARGAQKGIAQGKARVAEGTMGFLIKNGIHQTLTKLAQTIAFSPSNHSGVNDVILVYEDLNKYVWQRMEEKAGFRLNEPLEENLEENLEKISRICKEVLTTDLKYYVINKYGVNPEQVLQK